MNHNTETPSSTVDEETAKWEITAQRDAQRDALNAAHRLGFWRGVIRADREDLIADTSSPTYIKDRETDLSVLVNLSTSS